MNNCSSVWSREPFSVSSNILLEQLLSGYLETVQQLTLIEIPAQQLQTACLGGCSMCCYDRNGTGRWVEVKAFEEGVPEEMIAVDDDGVGWMKHRPDGSCVALAGGRCSIYEHRPLVCRQFEAETDCGFLLKRLRAGEQLQGAPAGGTSTEPPSGS